MHPGAPEHSGGPRSLSAPLSLRSATDCADRIEALYGSALDDDFETLHVTAVWAAPDGRALTLRINADTPRSPCDRFALATARARCDAIFTTGRILREEAALRHRYLDDAEGNAALAAWRREVLGRELRPRSVVLTSGRGIDFAHPMFHDGAPVALFTSEAAAAALRSAAPPGVEVWSDPDPSAHALLRTLRERGERVSIEAGGTTTASLYAAPGAVDEVMLSTYLGRALPESVIGPPFEGARQLDDDFRRVSSRDVEEASGAWRFARYRRS